MISFIITLIVLILIFGVLVWAIDQIGIVPPAFRQTAKALLALLLVLILLAALLGVVPMPALRGLA